MNRSLGLVPEMRNMEQAIAQENSLESKVELGLCKFFFSMWKTKGLLGFGSKMSCKGHGLKVSLVISLRCYWERGQFAREEGLIGGSRTEQGALEWDIRALPPPPHSHCTPPHSTPSHPTPAS